MSEETSLLETTGLTKKFDGLVAVENVDLSVKRNETRGIIGPNGAGKSTLFDLITGFLSPTTGDIKLDGSPITSLPTHERAQLGIGRSFQLNDLFDSLTVYENVRIGVQAKYRRRLNPFINARSVSSLNEQTETLLGNLHLKELADHQASDISYGDQRKLEIAVALASDPELLMLDEPTSGVGAAETAEMESLIADIGAEKTILLTEHDVDVIMGVSDSITVLDKGQIIAEGTPSEIADDEVVRTAYLGGVD